MRQLLLSILVFAIYSCSTRTIIRNGVPVPYKKVMREDFLRCENYSMQKHYGEARICLQKFIQEFRGSELADDAHYMLGRIYYQDSDFQNAIKHFKIIIKSYNSSELVPEASFSLASCYYQIGEHRKSYILLSRIDLDDVSLALRLKIYYLMARNAQSSKAYYTAVLWYLKAREHSKRKENIVKINNEVIRLIEEKLNKTELLSLADKFKSQFPSSYIHYRLGREYYRSLNPEQAKFYLDKLMKDKSIHTMESKYISDAGDLLARIESHNKIIKNRIGIILPLSGKFSSYGHNALKGIELAAGIFNNRSSAFDVELVVKDSQNDPTIAVKAAKNLLFEDHVAAIIGPLLSATALEVAETCEKLGIPCISLSQKNGVPETGDYTFRLATTNAHQVQVLAKYAVEKLGISKFAILHANDDYGNEMSQLFWNEVLKYSGEITNIESYATGQTDFKTEIEKISDRYYKNARSDEINDIKNNLEEKLGRKPRRKEIQLPPNIAFEAIFLPSFPREIGQVAPALSYGDIEGITMLGTNGWNSPNLIKRGGEFVEGAIFVDGFFDNSPYPVVKEFSTSFKRIFKVAPSIIEAHAYDAADILVSIVSQNKIETREHIQRALSSIKDYPGVTGAITFTETGEADKPLFILTVENEKIIQVN